MSKAMRRALLATSMACALVLSAAPSKANVVTTFELSGVLQYLGSVTRPLSATLTIDTTTGTVVGQTLVLPQSVTGLPVSLTQGYDAAAQAYQLYVNGTLFGVRIFFDTSSLVDYAGGDLGSTATPTPGGYVSTEGGVRLPPITLSSGSAVPVAVPEPASAALLLAGVAGLVLARRGASRSRKVCA